MKPFEANRLIEELSDQPERVRYLISTFIREMQIDFNRLMAALGTLDAEKVTKISHRMKGSAGLIGAEPIRAEAALIEALGRQGDLEMALARTSDLQNEFTQFCTYVPISHLWIDPATMRSPMVFPVSPLEQIMGRLP